jgi:hypothetical protein
MSQQLEASESDESGSDDSDTDGAMATFRQDNRRP